MSKNKLLVIEAHSDDSAISCLGYLEKYKDEYELHFILATVSDIHMHHCGDLTRDERLKEYEAYIQYLGGIWHRNDIIPFDADAKMDLIPKRDVVAQFEKVISKVEPEILIMQGPSFHHDHTIVYEAVIAATRPTARHCPNEMLIMENPTYVHSIGPSTDFKPSTYCALSEEEMNRKLDTFQKFFPSQIRESKNYLSREGIAVWGRYRGIECRSLYAEAFQTYIRVI
ncbi:hypothetical protein MTBPR1_20139 [Candidatus Terasakiella magnetica]|uniref:LmbE family protein n=1 Tax=Candidatus Terasakiella magnetica TaxID=1867952 RepID=A0A1C3RGB3_9PROT|nr:PIG-L family deacetylase [Candidatus Terasakiella magnetica]SCA56291.1 hypothetical protein MTBPR1_20139 [Candidatus Terasakiella magnetica]